MTCQPDVPDRDQHIIASCLKGETNPNGWMVTQGWAMAFRKYGLDYIGQKDEARLASRGDMGRYLRHAMGLAGAKLLNGEN